MSVTTVPFSDLVEEWGARSPDWYHIDCQLCDYQTYGGRLDVCEDQQIEHLESQHPKEHADANAQRLKTWLELNSVREVRTTGDSR